MKNRLTTITILIITIFTFISFVKGVDYVKVSYPEMLKELVVNVYTKN